MDTDYNGKVVKVLKKLLEPDFKVKNDVYLNSLLTHLTTKPENGCVENWRSATKQYIPLWIVEAVSQFEKRNTCSSPEVLSFTLHLASVICRDEQTFVTLNSRNIYERLITLININNPSVAPSIKLGFIKLISSFLEHKSGLQWIICTNYWADIMCLTLKNQTLYITKEGYKFMALLLVKSVSINEGFCFNVMQLITAPLSKNSPCLPRNSITDAMEVRDQAIYQSLCSSLTMINEILQILLEKINLECNGKVLNLFVEKFNLEEQIRCLLLIAQNEEFVFDLCRIIFMISLYEIYVQFAGQKSYYEADVTTLKSSKIFTLFTDNIDRGFVINVLKLSYVALVYWKYISDWMPVCIKHLGNPVPLLFENQMLMLQLFPIISVSFKILGERVAEQKLLYDDVREHYVDQLLKRSSQPTVRIFFYWKDGLKDNPYIFEHATLALNYLVKSKKMYTRDVAVVAFQTLVYCLQDILNVIKINSDQIVVLVKEHNYMALLLDSTTMFINDFNFTWRDSLESICVMNLAFEFLTIPMWSTKLVVKGLKLVDIAISKYLTANMALLIDNVSDSAMAGIGPLLYAKLHDSSWEVRDTALEVLCTISHNANTKFPSFRDIVLDADLPSLILKMALNDGESFVRATAVKCLQQMVKVQAFWDNLLQNGNVHDEIIRILQNETEGIVRCEAAMLVVDIYENHDIPGDTLTKYYDIMTHAASADLHWEVKVNALKFWETVINHHLTHQGMIDGTFPNVTFSKEHKKIVTLNEPEIRKRLIKILNQLSETGCLAVLVTALQDDCDIQVSKTATKITQDFLKLLKNYNVKSSDANLSAPPSPLNPFNTVPSPPYSNTTPSTSNDTYQSMSPMSQISDNGQQNNCMGQFEEMTDSILDEIINAQDLNLLRGVFNQNDELSSQCPQLRFRRAMTPSDFLKFVDSDLESHADDRAKWLRGMDAFGSLLDDILKEYDAGDVNSMDCY